MYVGGSSRASSSRGVKAKQPECQLNIKLNIRGGGGGEWQLDSVIVFEIEPKKASRAPSPFHCQRFAET